MNCNTTHYRANSSSVPGDPTFFAYTIAATLALVGFYGFLAPGVFWDDEVARPWGALWAVGVGLTLAASAWWLFETVRRPRAAEADAS